MNFRAFSGSGKWRSMSHVTAAVPSGWATWFSRSFWLRTYAPTVRWLSRLPPMGEIHENATLA